MTVLTRRCKRTVRAQRLQGGAGSVIQHQPELILRGRPSDFSINAPGEDRVNLPPD